MTVGIGVLIFVVILIIVSCIFGLIGRCQKPYSPDNNLVDYHAQNWDGESNLHLLVKSDKIYVLTINPVEKNLNILTVSDSLQVSLPYSYGYWLVSSIYDLGQAEKTPMGAKLLQDTLTLNLGLPIERYLIINDQKTPLPELVSQMKSNPLLAWQIFSDSKTDLAATELVKLWWGLRQVRADKIKATDLSLTPGTNWQILSDGSRVLGVSQIQLDQLLRVQTEDSQIINDGLTIGFYNTTDHLGLADQAARLASNIGGRVIFTTNLSIPFKETIIIGKSSYTTQLLANIFAPHSKLNCQKDTCQTSQPPEMNIDLNRADLHIFLGEDYYERYQKLP